MQEIHASKRAITEIRYLENQQQNAGADMPTLPLIFSFQASPDISHLLGTAERAKETNDLTPTLAPTAAVLCVISGCFWNLQQDFWHYTLLFIDTVFKRQIFLVQLNANKFALY